MIRFIKLWYYDMVIRFHLKQSDKARETRQQAMYDDCYHIEAASEGVRKMQKLLDDKE